MIVNPNSFRGLAYQVLDHLTDHRKNDDRKLTLPIIEADLRDKYGVYLDRQTMKAIQGGEMLESWRTQAFKLALKGDTCNKTATMPTMIQFMGRPYLSFVGIRKTNLSFVRADAEWQVKGLMEVNKKAVYYIDSGVFNIMLTPGMLLLDYVDVVGIPANPFPTDKPRSDPFFWEKDWDVPQHVKDFVKTQSIQFFLTTHGSQREKPDVENNGAEG